MALTKLFSPSACKKKKFESETSILLSLIKTLKFSAERDLVNCICKPCPHHIVRSIHIILSHDTMPVIVLVMRESSHLVLQLHLSGSLCTSEQVFQECINWKSDLVIQIIASQCDIDCTLRSPDPSLSACLAIFICTKCI